MAAPEFSARTRQRAIERFSSETFDILIIGGGITGAAAARDAASRGLSVALVEKRDFAWGTSSRSSKLIHGGLRYLENLEFGLVFEALAERALLLKTAPHMVRPLRFYFPVYRGDAHSKPVLGMGMWLYDLLSMFRAPGFHKSLSRDALLEEVPFLKADGLQGGFRYFDASMWDDVLAVQTLQSASAMGAAIANYVEAVTPIWEGSRVAGYQVRDLESGRELAIRARQLVVCAGPWTDEVGKSLSKEWRPWLNPSKGVHLVFDLKRIPVPGALVMSHPEDGRISFVIPRPDFGNGVVIVGTTDGQTPRSPEAAAIEKSDIDYLLSLLNRYFPTLELKASDILSGYVGVRPLFAAGEGQVLQKVSREHHIGLGPGGSVLVAGGKYTTHRKMAEEIIDFAVSQWTKAAQIEAAPPLPSRRIGRSKTKAPVNFAATPSAIEVAVRRARAGNIELHQALLERYGADSLEITATPTSEALDPEGFPMLEAQLLYTMRTEMVVHLEDFYFRRVPLYASRADHGLPWAEALARVWAKERGLTDAAAAEELTRLKAEIRDRSSWMKSQDSPRPEVAAGS